MAEWASLHLCIGRLNLSGSISWGTDDDAPEQPVFGPPGLVDVPDLGDDLGDRLGFRN